MSADDEPRKRHLSPDRGDHTAPLMVEENDGHAEKADHSSRRSRRFWASYAVVYDLIWDSALTLELALHVAHQITGQNPLGRHDCVIDLGCGTGLVSRELQRELQCEVVGVDSSPHMLGRALARKRIDRGVARGAEDTGLPNGSAAHVVTCNVLHLHPDPLSVVREAARLCAPRGSIVATWPVDGLDTWTMRDIDRRFGRRLGSAFAADMLRHAVGIAAAVAGTPRHTSAQLVQAIASWCGDSGSARIIADTTFGRCQRVMVIQPHGG